MNRGWLDGWRDDGEMDVDGWVVENGWMDRWRDDRRRVVEQGRGQMLDSVRV